MAEIMNAEVRRRTYVVQVLMKRGSITLEVNAKVDGSAVTVYKVRREGNDFSTAKWRGGTIGKLHAALVAAEAARERAPSLEELQKTVDVVWSGARDRLRASGIELVSGWKLPEFAANADGKLRPPDVRPYGVALERHCEPTTTWASRSSLELEERLLRDAQTRGARRILELATPTVSVREDGATQVLARFALVR